MFSKYIGSNMGREWLLHIFAHKIVTQFDPKHPISIGIIGGTIDDPEFLMIQTKFQVSRFEILGIENPTTYLDLNSGQGTEAIEGFDLLLCSQVLEHVWNHSRAFETLALLLKPNGLLWLNTPASNRPHGSPDYFSAGFTPGYLSLNLMMQGLSIIDSGSVGSKRNYFATHLLPYWLSVKAHRFPVIFKRQDTSVVKNLYFSLRYFFINVMLQFTAAKLRTDIKFATESWVIATRIVSDK